jgi:DNA-binding MarR family transcriptional regulator
MSRLQQQLRQSRPFASLAEEVVLNLIRTADFLRTAENAELKPHGLSAPQYNVLRILRGAGKAGHPCQEIGNRMVARVPDVTRLLDRLEQAGHIRRERGSDDRRVVQVNIEKRALQLLAKLDAPMAALAPKLLAGLSGRELQSLNELLVKARGDG